MPTFTNQALLNYNGLQTASNIAVGELVEVLTATKTAINTRYRPDTAVTYVVSLVNSGSAPLTGLTLTDNLGAYAAGTAGTVYPLEYVADSLRYYQNGALQTAPTVTAGPPMILSGITVPAGGNVTLVYDARVNRFAPPQTAGTITNTATLTGAGLTTPVTADETVTAAAEPALTISKSLSPTTVSPSGQITYTFLIQNTGNAAADATTGAVLTDLFNPILSNLTVTLNGTALTAPTQYTYDAATGLFSTVAGVVTVPAATVTQDPATGAYSIVPGTATITVTGTV